MPNGRPTDKDIALVTIAALYHGEISEGCAYDILGWNRLKIREALECFVPLAKANAYPKLVEALRVLVDNTALVDGELIERARALLRSLGEDA